MKPVLSMGRNSFKVAYPQTHGGVDDYIEITIDPDGSLWVRGFEGRLVVRADVANRFNIALEKW